MAAQRENLSSLMNLNGTERNTFTKQRERILKQSRITQLQKRLQELNKRELRAKQHNRQLLQQFEEAQDTLREMLTLTANMNTIRAEYERYLRENSPRWQQQLQEQTQAAQKQKMEEYFWSCTKNTQGMTKTSSDKPSQSQGRAAETQNSPPPQSLNNYDQDPFAFLPFSWLTHTQSQPARFLHQPQQSPPAPPIYTQPLPSSLPHFASSSCLHPPDWRFLQPNYPRSSTAGAAGLSTDLWGHFDTELPPDREQEQAVEKAETSRSPPSQRGGSGGSRRSLQELDVKPVRLSSGHAESSGSSRESEQASKESRKEKRGRSHRSSSEKEAHSSRGASRTSSATIFAASPKSSDSDISSEKGSSRRTKRSEGLTQRSSPETEQEMRKGRRTERNDPGSYKDESDEVENQSEESRGGKTGNSRCGSLEREESGGVSEKTEERSPKGNDKEGSESSEDSSEGEKEKEQNKVEDEMKTEKEEREEVESDESSDRMNTTEEDDETGAEEDMEEQDSGDEEEVGLKERDAEGSASSQDEDGEDGELDKEEAEEEIEEEEQREDKAEHEEDEDSDDCVIAPQENRIKKIYVIPEACENTDQEHDDDENDDDGEGEGSETPASDDSSNGYSDEDIENLLAPKEQSHSTEEKEESADEKPKESCDKVEIFQVDKERLMKTDPQSDSDEFDHFYD